MGRGGKNIFRKSTRNTLHVVLDDHSPGNENIVQKVYQNVKYLT